MTIRRLTAVSETERDLIADKLTDLFSADSGVLVAFLFGSFAGSSPSGKYGDMDIAILLTSGALVEPEHVIGSRVEAEIYRILSKATVAFPPPEVVILNIAPTYFVARILKESYLVLKGDDETFTRFIEGVSAKAMENAHFRKESLREVLGG